MHRRLRNELSNAPPASDSRRTMMTGRGPRRDGRPHFTSSRCRSCSAPMRTTGTSCGGGVCGFLQPDPGCRLHTVGYKPWVCSAVPRDQEEVEDMLADDQMPCHREWKWG